MGLQVTVFDGISSEQARKTILKLILSRANISTSKNIEMNSIYVSDTGKNVI